MTVSNIKLRVLFRMRCLPEILILLSIHENALDATLTTEWPETTAETHQIWIALAESPKHLLKILLIWPLLWLLTPGQSAQKPSLAALLQDVLNWLCWGISCLWNTSCYICFPKYEMGGFILGHPRCRWWRQWKGRKCPCVSAHVKIRMSSTYTPLVLSEEENDWQASRR